MRRAYRRKSVGLASTGVLTANKPKRSGVFAGFVGLAVVGLLAVDSRREFGFQRDAKGRGWSLGLPLGLPLKERRARRAL